MARDPITKAPEIWFKFCQSIHQDFGFGPRTFEEELLDLWNRWPRNEVAQLENYIESLIASAMPDGQLRKLFDKGGAEVIVTSKSKNTMREFFRELVKIIRMVNTPEAGF